VARKAQDRLEQARENAAAAMRELPKHPLDDRTKPLEEDDFGTMLQAACARLSESSDDDQDKLFSTSARQLLGPARAVEQALADAATCQGKGDRCRRGGGKALACGKGPRRRGGQARHGPEAARYRPGQIRP
jgi:hypothetical protein